MDWESKASADKQQPEFSLFHSNILYGFSFAGEKPTASEKYKLLHLIKSRIYMNFLNITLFADKEKQNFCGAVPVMLNV